MKKAQNQHTKTKNKAGSYKSFDELTFEERKKVNYDHPESIDMNYFSCYNCFKSKEAVKNDS